MLRIFSPDLSAGRVAGVYRPVAALPIGKPTQGAANEVLVVETTQKDSVGSRGETFRNLTCDTPLLHVFPRRSIAVLRS